MTTLSRLNTTAAIAAPPLHRLLHLNLSRFYAAISASQPQRDPDCYYSYYWSQLEPAIDRGRSAPMALDTESSVPRRGVQWAFIGSPRTKKHLYAELLSKLLEVPHISMASLVRQELNPHSSLYKQIADAVNRGKLVPEDIIFGLLSKRLEDGYYNGETGFILNGIPRSANQAEILGQLAEIDLVVNFKCTESFVVKNGRDRYWKEKVQAYDEQINMLEAYYKRQNRLVNFQVGNAPAETWQGLLAALHLQHLNVVHSSQKLPAGCSFL